jgi:hypothetical protein
MSSSDRSLTRRPQAFRRIHDRGELDELALQPRKIRRLWRPACFVHGRELPVSGGEHRQELRPVPLLLPDALDLGLELGALAVRTERVAVRAEAGDDLAAGPLVRVCSRARSCSCR